MNVPKSAVIELVDEMNRNLDRIRVLQEAIQVLSEEDFGKDEIIILADMTKEEVGYADTYINTWFYGWRLADTRARGGEEDEAAAPPAQDCSDQPRSYSDYLGGKASRRRT